MYLSMNYNSNNIMEDINLNESDKTRVNEKQNIEKNKGLKIEILS